MISQRKGTGVDYSVARGFNFHEAILRRPGGVYARRQFLSLSLFLIFFSFLLRNRDRVLLPLYTYIVTGAERKKARAIACDRYLRGHRRVSSFIRRLSLRPLRPRAACTSCLIRPLPSPARRRQTGGIARESRFIYKLIIIYLSSRLSRGDIWLIAVFRQFSRTRFARDARLHACMRMIFLADDVACASIISRVL